MASYTTLTLDTTAPSGTAQINAGDAYTTTQSVTLAITCADSDKSQMKIWGDVDTADNVNIQATEGASAWITFGASTAVKLSTGDGTKNLHVKIRDDVWNPSSQINASITLDTTAPTVSITSDVSPAKISKVSTKDASSFSWSSDVEFTHYTVRVVSSSSDLHTQGTEVPTTAGSSNTSGSSGPYPASTPITTTIKGTDLETAGAEGANTIKVFVQNDAGIWST